MRFPRLTASNRAQPSLMTSWRPWDWPTRYALVNGAIHGAMVWILFDLFIVLCRVWR